jgi:hypothetical protein
LTSHRPRGLRAYLPHLILKTRGKEIKIKAKLVRFFPLKARSATYPRRPHHLLMSHAEARKRKKALMLQMVVMASSRLMNSFPVRTRKVRIMR